MDKLNLQKGRRYTLELDDGSLEVLYRGTGDDKKFIEAWPHEFITPQYGLTAVESDTVISLRIREGGFKKVGESIIPIADESGRIFFSNMYSPVFDGGIGRVQKEQRESMIKEMIGAGL